MDTIDSPYKPPAVPPPLPPTSASKTDARLRKILSVLLLYPAFDIAAPFIGGLLIGQPLIDLIPWAILPALLVAAVVVIWRAHGKLLLLAVLPVLLGMLWTRALPFIALATALVLIFVLFSRLPKGSPTT